VGSTAEADTACQSAARNARTTCFAQCNVAVGPARDAAVQAVQAAQANVAADENALLGSLSSALGVDVAQRDQAPCLAVAQQGWQTCLTTGDCDFPKMRDAVRSAVACEQNLAASIWTEATNTLTNNGQLLQAGAMCFQILGGDIVNIRWGAALRDLTTKVCTDFYAQAGVEMLTIANDLRVLLQRFAPIPADLVKVITTYASLGDALQKYANVLASEGPCRNQCEDELATSWEACGAGK
jgi:hypothetical protein